LENAWCLLPSKEWITGFHKLLRENPSFLLMLFWWSSISVTPPHNLAHATRFSGQEIGVAEGGGKFNNYSAEIQNKTIISSTTMMST